MLRVFLLLFTVSGLALGNIRWYTCIIPNTTTHATVSSKVSGNPYFLSAPRVLGSGIVKLQSDIVAVLLFLFSDLICGLVRRAWMNACL